jgi:cysteine desulfurase
VPGPGAYLDHAATTPVDPRVLAAMLPYFSETYGNPSSVHTCGQQAEAAVESARASVASVLNCPASEVIFTGCGSESDNLALRGAAFAERERRGADRLLISPVEHAAVLRTARQLEQRFTFHIDWLRVDRYGCVAPEELRAKLSPATAVVSIVYANNEVGSINPISALAAECLTMEIPFHTDAVQAASQLPIDVQALRADLLALGAHKFYGPKGVGALYVKAGLSLLPWLTGGSQERGLRAGTHNVPLIIGLAEALRLTSLERPQRNTHMAALRDRIIRQVLERVPDAQLTGHPTERLPNHASFVFRGVDGNALLAALDLEGFACSSGSACKAGTPEPSEILLALGLPPSLALGSLRVTVGKDTRSDDVDRFLDVLPQIVNRLRRRAAGPQ